MKKVFSVRYRMVRVIEELGFSRSLQDLIDDLKSELGGNFEDLCVAMLTPPRVYDARQIHEAVSVTWTSSSSLAVVVVVGRGRSNICHRPRARACVCV